MNAEKALITGVYESNPQVNKQLIMNCRTDMFKKYKIEDKTMIVDKSIDYLWRNDLKNEVNACLIIEIKIARGKRLFKAGDYCQWHGKALQCQFKSNSNDDQLERLISLMGIWDKGCSMGPTDVLGDLNLDQHLPNDPTIRIELKDILPVFKDGR